MKTTEQWELAQEYLVDRGYEVVGNIKDEFAFTSWINIELERVNEVIEQRDDKLSQQDLKDYFDWGYDLGTAKTILNA